MASRPSSVIVLGLGGGRRVVSRSGRAGRLRHPEGKLCHQPAPVGPKDMLGQQRLVDAAVFVLCQILKLVRGDGLPGKPDQHQLNEFTQGRHGLGCGTPAASVTDSRALATGMGCFNVIGTITTSSSSRSLHYPRPGIQLRAALPRAPRLG